MFKSKLIWAVLLSAVNVLSAQNKEPTSVEKVLQQQTTFEFIETPLQQVVDYVSELHDVNVVVDHAAFKAIGTAPDELLVSSRLRGITLQAALTFTLRPLDADFIAQPGLIVITTGEKAVSHQVTRVYQVADLFNADEPSRLEEVVVATCHPDSWVEVGGLGTVRRVGKRLVVSQSTACHRQITELFASLRAALKKPLGTVRPPMPIEEKLAKSISLELIESPLRDVMDFIEKTAKLNIYLDTFLWEDIGANDITITARMKEVPLALALDQLLRPHGLGWTHRFGALVITSQPLTETYLWLEVYDVRDLVARDNAFDYRDIVGYLKNVAPTSWADVGGTASLAPLKGMLVIAQTTAGHREIRRALAQLRAIRAGKPLKDSKLESLEKKLQTKIPVDFLETPLPDVLDYMEDTLEVTIGIDEAALDDLGLSGELPVTLRAKNLSADTILPLLLGQMELTYTIHHGAVIVTTIDAEPRRHKLYEIETLLKRIDDKSFGAEELIKLIQGSVHPDRWDKRSDDSSIFVVDGFLAIRQTYRVHRDVRKLLSDLAKEE